jgi:outer membrane protein assembly factor BamB
MVSEAKNLPSDPGNVPPLWEVKLGTHQYSIPTIDRGRIYVAVNDGNVDRVGYKPTGGGAVICFEQATGKMLWRFLSPRFMQGVVPPNHFDQWACGVCSGPLVDGERVYVVGNRGEVLCLDREGQANGNDGPFMDELQYMGISGAGPLTPNPSPSRGRGEPENAGRDAGATRTGTEAGATTGTEAGATLLPTDGDIIWRFDMLKDADVIPHDVCGSTLVMVGDLLFACTSNGLDDKHDKVPKPFAPSLIVLDKKTGQLVAKDDEKIGTRCLHCNWSSPTAGMVNGKALVFFGGADGVLYAFEVPTAPSPLTPLPRGGEGDRKAGTEAGATTGTEAGATVQILKKVWSYDCNPADFRMKDGKPVPRSNHTRNSPEGPSEIISSPVFCDGRVYVAIGQSPVHGVGRGCLSCIDAATGAKVWDSQLVERTLATPAIAGGLLYIPDYTGNLHCFDAVTGQRQWVHPLGSKLWGSSALVADGKVFVGTEGCTFWTLKAGKQLEVLSQGRFKTVPVTPAAADGVLYVPTQRSLIAIPGK